MMDKTKETPAMTCCPKKPDPRVKRLILHLVAIAIVSFAIGFGIIAFSGGFATDGVNPVSLVNETMFLKPDITTIPMGNAQAAVISINQGMGHLQVEGGTDGALLESRMYAKPRDMKPSFETTISGNETGVIINENPGQGLQPGIPKRWDIAITKAIPVSLTVHSGTGDTLLDLGALSLRSLDIDSGVGNTRLFLDAYQGSDFNAKIAQSVGDLTIRVPKERNVRISVRKSVGDISTSGLKAVDGSYVTTGQPGIEITIMQGVGKVTLEAV